MRLSRYFLPILRETPKEADIVSHRLMLRAGMIRQEAAGIYAFLPLGLRVLDKVCRIVREEQNRSGAIELLMPTIQSAELWRESGRYEAYGKEMLRITDRHEREMLYGPTNEEMITEIFRAYVRSYKSLPLNLYHLQWKFRDEVRPRFGLMRGREFLMKDAYSFDLDFAGAKHAYNRMFVAYLRTFARMGLQSIPMVAESGPIGGNLSHEFIVLADTGESEVFCHRDYLDFKVPGQDVDFDNVPGLQAVVDKWTELYAATSDKHDAAAFAKLPPEKQISARGIEVGQVFYFGTKYSEPMKAVVTGPDGAEQPVHMGSYGIGPTQIGRRLDRGVPRRCRDQMAGGGRPVHRRDPQPQAGRERNRCGLRTALCRADRKRHRYPLRRSRRASGREIRHRRSDRYSLADPCRAARPRRRQSRSKAPLRRLAGTYDARGRSGPAYCLKLCAVTPRRDVSRLESARIM